MSALVSGYGSSDDEAPAAGPSKVTKQLPTLGNGYGNQADEDDEDETKLEAAARADAFGLTTDIVERNAAQRKRQAEIVAAAPDVLKDVSASLRLNRLELTLQDPNGAGMAIIARPTDKVMNVNITYEDMTRPVAGPQDPFNQQKNKGMNMLSGEWSPRSLAQS